MWKSVFALTVTLSCVLVASAQTNEMNNKAPNKSALLSPSKTTQAGQSTPSPEPDEATRLSVSVVEKYKAGKFDEALPLAKRALELREKTLAPDDPLIVSALRNLGEVYTAKEKLGDAITLFQRVLTIIEKKYGADDLRLGELLRRLALLNYQNGNVSKAETLLQRALAIKEKALGPMHTSVGQALYDLAEFYQYNGSYVQAEPLYQRAVEIREKTSRNPEEIAEAIDRYTCVLRKMKRPEEIERLKEHAAEILNRNDDKAVGQKTERGEYAEGHEVRGGVLNGRALRLPKPSYPLEAKAKGDSGKVIVQVTINEEGKVIHACALQGALTLMRASEVAAVNSTFSPTKLDGKPVKVTGIITYDFLRF